MDKKFSNLFRRISLFLLLGLFLAGCAAPLQFKYTTVTPEAETREPVKISIAPFTDARETTEPKKVGKIEATVFDMSQGELVLSEEPRAIVEAAFAEEFRRAGFEVAKEEADFALRGEVKEFRLDIAGRDEIEIALALEVKDGAGRTVWADTIREKDSRYAGVFGNTRATITKYISTTLSRAVGKAVSQVSPLITKGAAKPPEAGKSGEAAAAPPTGMGRLTVATEPERAKVYIDGVYYGLTPATIDLKPGVYELAIKKEGFLDLTEKVAVGEGRTTELDETLGK